MASLLKTLSDIKKLHQGGFSISEARQFIGSVNDKKNDAAVLPAHLLYKIRGIFFWYKQTSLGKNYRSIPFP